jgi:hypothetical protein
MPMPTLGRGDAGLDAFLREPPTAESVGSIFSPTDANEGGTPAFGS